jgi:hypothetical protein
VTTPFSPEASHTVDWRKHLRIVVHEEQKAATLARELSGLPSVALTQTGEEWEVSVDCPSAGTSFVVVLDAVRRALGGDPSASARVLVDGSEYTMQGV